MHTHKQSLKHTSLNKNAGLDVMQSYPLCRIRFDQHQDHQHCKKWGATLHPWATMPSQLLKLFFNNQYGVVPQGCNVAPHFNIELC